jgi:hypothetical protein
MSQVTHPTTSLRSQVRAHWIVGISALLALLATAAVALVLAIDGGSSDTSSVAQTSQPAVRSDGGPDETAVAGFVGTRGGSPAAGRPDESRIAASVAGH